MAATLKILDPLLTTEEFAEYAKITEKHAIALRRAGKGPEYIRCEGTRGDRAQIRYRASKIEKWLSRGTVRPTRGKSA